MYPEATLSDHHSAWHRTFGRYTTCPMDCGAGEVVEERFLADHEALEADGRRGIICGSCKGRHATVATVKFCYEVKYDAQTFERNERAMIEAIENEGECEHGLSQALCAGPGHYPMDKD